MQLRYNFPVAVIHAFHLAEEALYEYALKALSKRSLTIHELRKRLYLRASRKKTVGVVIARLLNAGYLDDRRLADSYASIRLERDGLGRHRVLMDLRNRGVDKNLAEKAVDKVYEGVDENELIIRQLQRKFGDRFSTHPPENLKKTVRLYRFLVRAGFSSDKIENALRVFYPGSDLPIDFPEHPFDPEEEVFD